MPQQPRRSIFTGGQRVTPYPGYGQIPLFTPPFVPSGGGTPVPQGPVTEPSYTRAAPEPGSPAPTGVVTLPDGSLAVQSGGYDQQRGANGEQPMLTPEQQALYAPDLAPPGAAAGQPQKGRFREFLDRLTSQPNSTALLTMGGILSSAPQQGESPLAQFVRAAQGGVSTLGLFAQQRAAQAEAARKASLENREQTRKERDTANTITKTGAEIRQGDRKIDVEQQSNEAKLAQEKAEQADLKAYRADRLAETRNELSLKQDQLRLAQRELSLKRQAHEDDNAFKTRQENAKAAQDKIQNDIAWARVKVAQANSANTKEALDNLKYWDPAMKVFNATGGLETLTAPTPENIKRLQGIIDNMKKGKPLTTPPPATLDPKAFSPSVPK